MELSEVPPSGTRNIVVCLDGTGNEFSKSNSNVVKFYTCLKINQQQIGYYHPGVGTMGAPNRSTRLGKLESKVAGLAVGAGFMDNVGGAYRFLMDHYRDGDRIFLVGFSRGAYAVRALAGALHLYGLLCPGNEGHLPYLLGMYGSASRDAYNKEKKTIAGSDESAAFKQTFSREVAIHFAGVWDTVSSVGWIYDPVKLLFDGQNPIVRKGRHAVSIDEHRCFFQDNLWGSPLPTSQTPLFRGQQDIVQAWFPGVHSDVGGSYPQPESGPSQAALEWMLTEAVADGVLMDQPRHDAVFGMNSIGLDALTNYYLPQPKNSTYRLHNSLTLAWMPLEVFPHKYFDANGKKRWQLVPWLHRREIPSGALFHPMVRALLSTGAYKPKNLDTTRMKPLSPNYSSPALPIPAVVQKLAANGFEIYE